MPDARDKYIFYFKTVKNGSTIFKEAITVEHAANLNLYPIIYNFLPHNLNFGSTKLVCLRLLDISA
jgi:hypothetical protein